MAAKRALVRVARQAVRGSSDVAAGHAQVRALGESGAEEHSVRGAARFWGCIVRFTVLTRAPHVYSVKNITFEDLGIIIDITKPLAVQRVAFRAIHQQYNDAESRAQLVKARAAAFEGMSESEPAAARPTTRMKTRTSDEAKGSEGGDEEGGPNRDISLVRPRPACWQRWLRLRADAFTCLQGGVIYVEMLSLPGQPKAVNKWTLHQCTRQPAPVSSRWCFHSRVRFRVLCAVCFP